MTWVVACLIISFVGFAVMLCYVTLADLVRCDVTLWVFFVLFSLSLPDSVWFAVVLTCLCGRSISFCCSPLFLSFSSPAPSFLASELTSSGQINNETGMMDSESL